MVTRHYDQFEHGSGSGESLAVPTQSSAAGFDLPSILLVDDDDVLCRVQSGFLKRFGYYVRSAQDGDQALAVLAENG